jgi:hypothetical protein
MAALAARRIWVNTARAQIIKFVQALPGNTFYK